MCLSDGGNHLAEGLPFESSKLWWSSAFDSGSELDAGLFALPDFDIKPLDLPEDIREDDTPFQIADILDLGGGREQVDGSLPRDDTVRTLSPTTPAALLEDIDLWQPDFCITTEPTQPRLLTWESFEGKAPLHDLTSTYLSEAGPSIFDAALARGPHRHLDPGVLPQDVTLRALCALVLGRSSVFFSWDVKQERFVKMLQNVPISGYSVQCCDSFMEELLEYGALVRYLRTFAGYVGNEYALPSVTALRRCVDIILDSLEISLAKQLQDVRSIQQLQYGVDQPRQLLETLQSLVDSAKDAVSEESAISSISEQISTTTEAGSVFASLLREVLTRVCAPWLTELANDLGLGDSATAIISSPGEDDETSSLGEVTKQLPSFISPNDYAIVREAKASLRILLRHDLTAIAALHGRIASRETCSSEVEEVAGTVHDDDVEDTGDLLRSFDVKFSDLHQSTSPTPFDNLTALTEQSLTTPTDHQYGLQLLAVGPYDHWRPKVIDQYQWINHRLLHHLFIACHLVQHLELQHHFHLFGNGEFVSQLSTALFSADTQTAERRRGVLPTSETVGLRLGAVDNKAWPPASSELRLALLGVLNDVYFGTNNTSTSTQQDMPGGLSFSIRELPDDDIERVMDPTSMYALDFLRLQYTAPAPLDAILTPVIMEQYDEIFRFMVRMMRLSYDAVQFRHNMLKDPTQTDKVFSVEVHHIISTLMSHFTDIGINEPWRAFMYELLELQSTLNSTFQQQKKVNGMEYVRGQHMACLERIRTRLFLKQRQDKLRATVQDIFIAALDTIYKKDPMSLAETKTNFRGAVSALLELLQEVVDKPARTRKTSDKLDSDLVDPARILLVRLDYNGFYRRCV